MNIAKLGPRSIARLLSVACISALAAIALMVWSIMDPRPFQVIMAMSIGQVLGTLSFGLFLFVVAADLLRTRRELQGAKKSDVTSA